MKKKHPCGSRGVGSYAAGSGYACKVLWISGRMVLIARSKFMKGTKKILNRDMNEKLELEKRSEESTMG